MTRRYPDIRAGLLAAVLALATVLPGCGGTPLNSDRIRATYGSYTITVLDQDRRWRVSSLASLHDGRPVTRTLALVRFENPGLRALAREDRRIRAGASIGSTFREFGWSIDKPTIFLDNVALHGEAQALASLMDIRLPATLAVHAYRFNVRSRYGAFTYATIIELHHPDYLDVEQLAELHAFRPGSGGADGEKLLAGLRAVLTNLPEQVSR